MCHKERLTRFSFNTQEGTALRITTNHVERMWVELRRECKSLVLDKAREFILLEPNRERFLFHRSWVENVETVLRHFGEIGPDLRRKQSFSLVWSLVSNNQLWKTGFWGWFWGS